MRTLHTLKGGARLAGAMRLGEMAHRLETRIERLTARRRHRQRGRRRSAAGALRRHDAGLRRACAAAMRRPMPTRSPRRRAADPAPRRQPRHRLAATARPPDRRPRPQPPASHPQPPSWAAAARRERRPGRVGDAGAPVASPRRRRTGIPSRSAARAASPPRRPRQRRPIATARSTGRASRARRRAPARPAERAHARRSPRCACARRCSTGSSTRPARSASRARGSNPGVGQIKGSLSDLTENLERLRGQLRDIELQGEVQMTLAPRGGEGGVADLRPARVRPLHPLPGADADDGRVGQRRRHACSARCSARSRRRKTSWSPRRA